QIGGITFAEKTRDAEIFGQADVARNVSLGPINRILFGARYVSHTNSSTTLGGAAFTNQNFTLADLGPYVLDADLYDGLGVSGNGTPYA
ncbi:TonB-dependent receptor, partial [Escherichia coli]|nr:TonB-dependent receptor [Escherichia coli]